MTHTFEVRVLEGKGLQPSKHLFSSPQVYINVRLVRKKEGEPRRGRRASHLLSAEDVIMPTKLDRTAYAKVANGAAKFGEHPFSWPFDVASLGCYLVVKVKEKTMLADIDDMLALGPRAAWYTLEPKMGGEPGGCGELLIQTGALHVHGQGGT